MDFKSEFDKLPERYPQGWMPGWLYRRFISKKAVELERQGHSPTGTRVPPNDEEDDETLQ